MHRTTDALQKLRVAPLHPPFKLPENKYEVHDIPLQQESRSIWKDLTELNKASDKGMALITKDGKQMVEGKCNCYSALTYLGIILPTQPISLEKC